MRGERGGISAVTVSRQLGDIGAMCRASPRSMRLGALAFQVHPQPRRVVVLNERQQLRHQQRRILNVCKLLLLLLQSN